MDPPPEARQGEGENQQPNQDQAEGFRIARALTVAGHEQNLPQSGKRQACFYLGSSFSDAELMQ